MIKTRSHYSSLTVEETKEIEHTVDFELNENQLRMTKVGAITNIIGGLFVVWALYGQVPFSHIIAWYSALFIINVINIAFTFYYQYRKVTADTITTWLNVYHYLIMPPVCVTWGLIPVLFSSIDLHHQIYIFVLLLAVLISFSFATITDFKAAMISTMGLLTPFVAFHAYLGIQAILTTGHDADLHLPFSLIIFTLGIFLSSTSYIGNKLIKKSFKLTSLNVLLNEKLEGMNESLEARVKQRTIELEDSLALVTYQSTHDLLTDLPNQRLLFDFMESAINAATLNHHMFAVVFYSLNEIERINEGLGNHAGDVVIKTIAQRFKVALKQANLKSLQKTYTLTLSRQDIFIMIVEPIIEINQMESLIQPLFLILEDPVQIENQSIKLTASVGLSIFPQDGRDIEALVRNAMSAMQQAKKIGGNTLKLYTSENGFNISKQLQLESLLHAAVKNHEFILNYQPIINLKTGKIACVEALVRWHHPILGLIKPDYFIPLAEANGSIIPIGDWVLQTACTQAKAWEEQGFDLKVAINLSSKQLQKKNMLTAMMEILKNVNLNPQLIELELTESVAFKQGVLPVLKQFKTMGLNLVIDDFGTGFSGLSNLKLFDIYKLKIDKSFIIDIDKNDDSKAIVANIISLAKSLNIKVLAEGVETIDQLRVLQKLGCEMVQGFYFSKPLDALHTTELLSHQPSSWMASLGLLELSH